MSEENRKSFVRWLSDQAYRNDNTGIFARSIIAAENVPKSSKYMDWFNFIKGNKHIDRLDAFSQVWDEYFDEGMGTGGADK